ncbi:MAG: hypothetical protein NC184_04450 [Roseburia sp.]|nr:hypothetical protein [Roseburia sp.]
MVSIKKDITVLSGEAFLRAPVTDTSIDLEIYGASEVFSAVKSKLLKLYGGDVLVVADGRKATLSEVERCDVIEVSAQPDFRKNRYNAADVLRVIDRLTRDDGCPWDRVQTHDSIRINMIEEAYEAVDAIDKRDVANMREEFGDVLLQSVLQSDISRRSGEFDFDDVCDELCKKLIGRHTFIFGGDSAENADDALTLWEKAKAVEKNYDSVKTQLGKLPETFPSLLLLQKIHKKLKKSGAACDDENTLAAAVGDKDYARAIAACVALLSDGGADAEAELNSFAKKKIADL